jgi:hypothetical protein
MLTDRRINIELSDYRVIESHPQSRVSNSQPHGIGRVTAFDDLVAVNNLGRNIVLMDAASDTLTPLAKFDETIFPDDEMSQFDLDMHALLPCRSNQAILAVNHYGRARLLHLPAGHSLTKTGGTPLPLEERHVFQMPGDIEQFHMLDTNLISGSAKGYQVPDPPVDGILAFVRIASAGQAANPLLYKAYFSDWGSTTALAVDKDCKHLAVAFGKRLALTALVHNENNEVVPGDIVFETQLDFVIRFLEFGADWTTLIAAGHAAGTGQGEQDWDELEGGGWARLERSGRVTACGDFEEKLAWGNGAETVVIFQDKRTLLAVDKWAGLTAIDTETGTARKLVAPYPQQTKPLGLAHASMSRHGLFVGFNRDGYRLHRYRIKAT